MASSIEYIEKLRKSGLRPTKQRIRICEVLFNANKTFHFTINDLVKMIEINTNQKISLATVYILILCGLAFLVLINFNILTIFW